MATLIMETSKSAQRRRRFAIHKMQKAYAVHTGLLLFLYSSVFFVLAFFGPYVAPAITLFTDGPLQERDIAAKELLLLSETVWVAVPVLFFGAVIFSSGVDPSRGWPAPPPRAEHERLGSGPFVMAHPISQGRPTRGPLRFGECRR